MKQLISYVILFLLSLNLSISAFGLDSLKGPGKENNEEKNYVDNELLIKFKKTSDESTQKHFITIHGFSTIEVFESIEVHRIRLPEGMSIEEALEICTSDPSIEYAEPNYHRQLLDTKNSITSKEKTMSSNTSNPNDTTIIDKKRCFIATVAYGSPLAKEVTLLCEFRDKYLLKYKGGQMFVRFYYNTSPFVANFIREKEFVKSIVRVMLKPAVYIARNLVDNYEEHYNE